MAIFRVTVLLAVVCESPERFAYGKVIFVTATDGVVILYWIYHLPLAVLRRSTGDT
jgi:hypothetical protein